MSAETTFVGLPGWAKGAIAVAGTATAIFIAYKVYSAIQKRIKLAGDYKQSGEVKKDLADLIQAGIKPSYTDSEYSSMANKVYTAFDGYTSDPVAVGWVMARMKNDADVLKLINAYGVRTISSGKGNPTPDFSGTMSSAITDELSTSEVIQLNKILQQRGIKIKF